MNSQRNLLAVMICLSSQMPMAFADETTEQSDADGWSTSLLVGIAATPGYTGDDDIQGTAVMDVRVEYANRFFASLFSGIGYNIIRTEHWRAGPIITYDFGRDEEEGNPLSLFGDDVEDLIGLGDLDGSVEAGAFIAYEKDAWQTKLEVRQGLDGGHEGLIGAFELKFTGQTTVFGKPSFYAVGPEVIYGDQSYSQAYFGITAEQAARSGLAQYDADAGLVSYGLHANLTVPLTDKWAVSGFAGYDRLGSQASDSPLIVERGSDNQIVGGILFSYRF